MWIVRLALRAQYTVVVMALLIMILGTMAIRETPTDIFPNIDIPVVSIIWQYSGMPPAQFEKYITTFSEYTVSSGVSDVRRIESHTVNGAAVIKIFFQPNVNIGSAVSQVTAFSQTILRRMPPGTVPPLIIQYDAASVPIIQLSLASNKMSEAQLYDFGIYRVRAAIAPVRGSRLPLPYGGKPRQIQVDLDPQAMQANGITSTDISNAIAASNIMQPTGSAKIGSTDYIVGMNSNPESIDAMNDIPIRSVNGRMVYIRDVGHVRDGFGVQTNIVRNEGRRGALLTVLKTGQYSTLDVVQGIKDALPALRAQFPDIEITTLFDQSVFVKASIDGVITEGLIAALLTAIMILLFLGSWRSTLIVLVSIPLSVMVSLMILSLTGQTLNIMTLGGLALAVGILVDDATVELENIHRNRAMGKPLEQAILDGAQQIAVPAFVSTLCICIVFVSVVFLTGPAKYLFTSLALAVVYAMLASYFLSRTVVPVMVRFLLRSEHHDPGLMSHNPFSMIHRGFEAVFERFRAGYVNALNWGLHNRPVIFGLFAMVGAASLLLIPFIGRDFFPTVDAGQIRLHVTAAPGTRLEETEVVFSKVEAALKKIIPAEERAGQMSDNIGQPQPVNMAFSDASNATSFDGEILISLAPEHKVRTEEYVRRIREELPHQFPDLAFFFLPADIVNQILNFGIPAPIDIQVTGYNPKVYSIAKEIEDKLRRVQGTADVHLHQVVNAPALHINVDRTRAAELGLTQRDVGDNTLIALSSSAVVNYNLWPDPKSGVGYVVAVQTPQHLLESLDDLLGITLPSRGQAPNQLLGNVATVQRRTVPALVSHVDIAPVYDVMANVQGRDLGSVSSRIDDIVADYCPKPESRGLFCPAEPGALTRWMCSDPAKKDAKDGAPAAAGAAPPPAPGACAKLPPGVKISVRGQVESMNTAFVRMGWGMLFAAMLVYFMMVVNFQSWTDPFIIITALPGALCGMLWMLFITGTTFNVPSMMGAIMSLGVATANSILMVTFANEQMREGRTANEAALAAGFTRLRPVIMTALAMVMGMIPMAMGFGEGGEQNAPLGRAVIGGLMLATVSTLFFVPVVFSVLHGRRVRDTSTSMPLGRNPARA